MRPFAVGRRTIFSTTATAVTAFLARGKQAALRVEPLAPEGLTLSAESLPLPGRHGRKGEGIFTIRLATQRAQWRNAVAFSWSPAGTEPTIVALRTEGERWTFVAGGRMVKLYAP